MVLSISTYVPFVHRPQEIEIKSKLEVTRIYRTVKERVMKSDYLLEPRNVHKSKF